MRKRRVVILGGGPSGLSVAWGLVRDDGHEVTVLEAMDAPGGLSRTIEREGLRFDIGPHRLSAQLPEMLEAVRELLGGDLIERRNFHGVYFDGKLYNYPPRIADFLDLGSLKNTFVFGMSWLAARARSAVSTVLFGRAKHRSFEETIEYGFGRRFSRTVIFPMIAKVWGTRDLHAEFARIRFQLPTVGNVLMRLVSKRARLNSRYFYYPSGGFGMIWERLSAHLQGRGVRMELGVRVEAIAGGSLKGPFRVRYMKDGSTREIEADVLVSSISNRALMGYMRGTGLAAPIERLSGLLETRTLRLGVFLVRGYHLPTRVIIVPEGRYIFNRISEMNLFADLGYPEGHSVLMVDVITDHGSELDLMADDEFNHRLLDALLGLGWFGREDVVRMLNVRVPEAYPVLSPERHDAQERIEAHFAGTAVVLTGREASSDYNNAHNAIAKGFLAADYIAGKVGYEEFAHSARILGRLPIQD